MYLAWIAVRHIMNALKNRPIPGNDHRMHQGMTVSIMHLGRAPTTE